MYGVTQNIINICLAGMYGIKQHNDKC